MRKIVKRVRVQQQDAPPNPDSRSALIIQKTTDTMNQMVSISSFCWLTAEKGMKNEYLFLAVKIFKVF